MSFDEMLFQGLTRMLNKSLRKNAVDSASQVNLTQVQQKLTLMARAITGHAIDIFPAEREGGFKGDSFFLPAAMPLFNSTQLNLNFYLFRLLYLSVQRDLGHQWPAGESNKPTVESRHQAAMTSGQVLAVLFDSYPVTREWYPQFLAGLESQPDKDGNVPLYWLFGKWMENKGGDASGKQLENFSPEAGQGQNERVKTLIKSRAIEAVIRIEIDKKQQEEYMLTHNFEKVETAEEFDGIWRDFDGKDELSDHQDALDELNLKYTVRSDDTAHSVYKADFIEDVSISESAEMTNDSHFLLYDEWDYAKRAYKKDFCKVFPQKATAADPGYYKNTMAKNGAILSGLRKMLTSINNKSQLQRRQTQGNEFDLDALTDMYVDIHSHHTPSEKVYLSNRKKEKDLSILLLLDVSLSSDGYANGNRVIDVEKEVSILFGEILNEFNIDFAIGSFNSKTRNHSNYELLKDFDDSWAKSRSAIGAIQPGGYTRIGAALRHSGTLLGRRPSKKKWVILLSDGKPNDYDRYEGKYGIHDVKQALRELNSEHINSYALAIEAQARYYLPLMFGQNHYQILTTPAELLQSMVKLYEKIKYQA